MIIQVLFFKNKIYKLNEKTVSDLKEIKSEIEKSREIFKSITIEKIIDLFHQFGRELLHNKEFISFEGVPFLSNWLRKGNIEKIVIKNLGSFKVLKDFIGEGRKKVKAQPRGVICHWIAGNVPTLGFFSLIQSILVGNSNIVKIPPESQFIFLELIKLFGKTEIEGLKGSDILKTVAVIDFSPSDTKSNLNFSLTADARVIWGGQEAVDAISKTSKMSHCDDIVFGPKYSFGIVDKKAQESEEFPKLIRRFVNDIIIFDQSACSSPQVIFFEKGPLDLESIGKFFEDEFKLASKRFPKNGIDQFIASKIINIRAEYALAPEKKVIASKENDWTILMDDNIRLEEPVQSRTIFLKEVDSVMDCVDLITPRIQTIGTAIYNRNKLLEFTDAVTYKGVARCVLPGQMNFYDSPWDGIYFLNRLVRWVTLYMPADEKL
ncbi:MAG: acyl-CoA reductase [Candidatus Helarchaeota archaeon]|nr:acyl-CoA reductase [Candidatus Helarchaeota archaeon]